MLEGIMIMAVGFKPGELRETIRIWSLEGVKLHITEVPDLGCFWERWSAHEHVDVLAIRLYGEPHNVARILELGSITQYKYADQLPLIMVADHSGWVECAYEVGASGLLLYPIDENRLTNTMNMIKARAATRRKTQIVYQKNRIWYSHKAKTICWINYQPPTSKLHLCDTGKTIEIDSCEYDAETYQGFALIQPHIIVNMARVLSVAGRWVVLDNSSRTRLPIQRDRVRAVMEAYRQYWR